MEQVSSTSKSGRSVLDFQSEEQLRQALEAVIVSTNAADSTDRDWILPVPDAEAVPQTVGEELQRLLALKSYLVLDAEKEEAFDNLTREARQEYHVPTSLISLVDLGRQFLFSNTGNPGDVRETPRSLAFCAHTILNKHGICVVNDTLKDERFRNSKLVREEPFLRFYAGAPLISPEGYNLGTFCVEGPEPRPEGLSKQEKNKLKAYAAKAMDLLVQRRRVLRDRLSNNAIDGGLQRHAAVANNLGVILFTEHSDSTNAMRLFQEAVQTLMYVQGESIRGVPSKERQNIMRQLLTLLTDEYGSPESRASLVCNVALLYCSHPTTVPAKTGIEIESCYPKDHSHLNFIPAMFSQASKLRGTLNHKPLPFLSFGEPFKVDMNAHATAQAKERYVECPFVIPVNQCSKATLFNMGLIHYHLGSADTAVQFFDLAVSLSATTDPLAFDPVVLACLNNIAHVHLHFHRPNDARDILSDALTRGNAALANMYKDIDRKYSSSFGNEENRLTRRLRRKLARTVMNLGHVHFFNCEYGASDLACSDALRLMRTNMDDVEVAAVWYNISLLRYHEDKKIEALEHIDKFLELAYSLKGANHVQIADALFMKGQIIFEMGHLYRCMVPLNASLTVRRQILGENNSAVAESLCLVGRVLQAREEYDFALSALKQALEVQRSLAAQASVVSFDVAHILLEVGRTYRSQGQLVESLKVYKEVAELTKCFFGDRHAFVARVATIIGNLYLESGHVKESLAAFEKAMRIRAEQGLAEEVDFVEDQLACFNSPQNTVAPTA